MLCPDCKTELHRTEDVFWDFLPGEGVEMEVAGRCPNCGRKFLWTRIYELKTEKDLEDDE